MKGFVNIIWIKILSFMGLMGIVISVLTIRIISLCFAHECTVLCMTLSRISLKSGLGSDKRYIRARNMRILPQFESDTDINKRDHVFSA